MVCFSHDDRRERFADAVRQLTQSAIETRDDALIDCVRSRFLSDAQLLGGSQPPPAGTFPVGKPSPALAAAVVAVLTLAGFGVCAIACLALAAAGY